jgi:hypothetical protein
MLLFLIVPPTAARVSMLTTTVILPRCLQRHEVGFAEESGKPSTVNVSDALYFLIVTLSNRETKLAVLKTVDTHCFGKLR